MSGGDPGAWNEVVLVPKDAYRNMLLAGALDGTLVLSTAPVMPNYRPFQVGCPDSACMPAR